MITLHWQIHRCRERPETRQLNRMNEIINYMQVNPAILYNCSPNQKDNSVPAKLRECECEHKILHPSNLPCPTVSDLDIHCVCVWVGGRGLNIHVC